MGFIRRAAGERHLHRRVEPEKAFGASNAFFAGISMGSLIALGLARLSFSLLVPTMRVELGWSYETIGWMGTALTAGYMIGALAVPNVVSYFGSRATFIAGLLATSVTLVATGFTTNPGLVALLRILAGLATAFVFVVGSTLIAASAGNAGRARVGMCLFLGGGGVGMVVTAIVVPFLADQGGWQTGWLAIGGLALCAGIAALPAALTAVAPPNSPAVAASTAETRSKLLLLPTFVSYTLFGAGYLAFATFVIAHLRFRLQFSSQEIAVYWGICGAAGVIGSFCWLPVLRRFSGGTGIGLLNFCTAFGAGLAVFVQSRLAAYASAFFFGLSFLTVAAAVLIFARSAVTASNWTRTMAWLTVCFSVGQCIGPTLAGMVADRGFGVEGGLVGAVGLLLLATAFALLQRTPVVR
jgi:predicted MFS family arabinose efflux permease